MYFGIQIAAVSDGLLRVQEQTKVPGSMALAPINYSSIDFRIPPMEQHDVAIRQRITQFP